MYGQFLHVPRTSLSAAPVSRSLVRGAHTAAPTVALLRLLSAALR
ncbi:hypothetical protein Cus16_0398 [Curtobacterium sp. ER1/6]|nr:hypothetical protein Cus16_0398 [Curtobacterium sp. ER1/6]